MARDWSKLETRLAFRGGDYPDLVLEFVELPQKGDLVAIKDLGIFEVVERGFTSSFANQPPRFLLLNEIEGQNIAPSGRFNFLY